MLEDSFKSKTILSPQNSMYVCPHCYVGLKIGVKPIWKSPTKVKIVPTRTFECPECDYKMGPFSKKSL